MEEWAGVTDAEERRRIQNRLAQRKRRERLRSHERSRSCSTSRTTPPRGTPSRTYSVSNIHESPMPYQPSVDLDQSQFLSGSGMMDFGNTTFSHLPMLTQPFTHADMAFNWSDSDMQPPLELNVSSIDDMATSAFLGNDMPLSTVAPLNIMPDMTDDLMRRINESTIDDARKRSWSVDTMPTWPCTSPPDSLLNDPLVPNSKLETKIDTAISSLVKLYESGVYLDMLKEDPNLTNDLETIRQRIRLNASNTHFC